MPAIKLISSGPLEEREIAATQFLVLGQTIWPATVVLILACASLSHVPHPSSRRAPVWPRADRQRVGGGDLSLRIRLRKGDQL